MPPPPLAELLGPGRSALGRAGCCRRFHHTNTSLGVLGQRDLGDPKKAEAGRSGQVHLCLEQQVRVGSAGLEALQSPGAFRDGCMGRGGDVVLL